MRDDFLTAEQWQQMMGLPQAQMPAVDPMGAAIGVPSPPQPPHMPAAGLATAMARLTGNFPGEERQQTWPERTVRSGFTAAHDALAGKLPMYVQTADTGEIISNPEVLGRAGDMAGLMGTGALASPARAMGEAVLGAGPVRRTPKGGPYEKFAPKVEEILAKPPEKTLFDYSKLDQIPDRPQRDLERFVPPRGVSARVQSLITNPQVIDKMMQHIEAGRSIGPGAQNFYYTEPLRDAFIAELGRRKGPQSFGRYIDFVSGSSPRSKIEANARNASYYYVRDAQGKGLQRENPYPYGHMAQDLHRQNFQTIQNGGWDLFQNPKPPSFAENLRGNYEPVTADAHAIKLPAMLSRDPRFLSGAMKIDKDQPTINPAKLFAQGKLTMDQALERPVYWVARPRDNEYGAMEQFYKMLSRESGLRPAQGQGSAWASGGPTTGLGSMPGDPFIRAVENRVNVTADARGLSPAEALSQMIRGKKPLLATGGFGPGTMMDPRDQ